MFQGSNKRERRLVFRGGLAPPDMYRSISCYRKLTAVTHQTGRPA
jgi:hypothetical protein